MSGNLDATPKAIRTRDRFDVKDMDAEMGEMRVSKRQRVDPAPPSQKEMDSARDMRRRRRMHSKSPTAFGFAGRRASVVVDQGRRTSVAFADGDGLDRKMSVGGTKMEIGGLIHHESARGSEARDKPVMIRIKAVGGDVDMDRPSELEERRARSDIR